MVIGVSFLIIVVSCVLLYLICKYSFDSKRSNSKRDNTYEFKADVSSNYYVNDYIKRMPQQYKDNSRVIQGTGKMHFTETIVEGSTLVRKETISVLASIGERFS